MSGYTEIVRDLQARLAREEAAEGVAAAPGAGVPVGAAALLAAPLLAVAAAAPVAAATTPQAAQFGGWAMGEMARALRSGE